MCLLAQQAVSAASLLRKSDARVVDTILQRRGGRWCPCPMSSKTEVNYMCLVLENWTAVPLIVQPPAMFSSQDEMLFCNPKFVA